jgi:hypothetical protein
MSEVVVEERGTAAIPPPTFKIAPEPAAESALREGEDEWISNVVGGGERFDFWSAAVIWARKTWQS